VSTTSTSAAVSADQALAKAGSSQGFLANESGAAYLVNFTDYAYGQEMAPNAQSASTIAPTYVDREAWAVVFLRVTTSVAGGIGTFSGTVDATYVAFIDAQSGQFRMGISFSN
jgi:hypothetical protein